ncbi:MAG: hypothetical protein D6704_00075 [Nitrospirae bacterium]|nr:MAG: hypothetical protein D6704_00075 [Nitrospirota bacterium]
MRTAQGAQTRLVRLVLSWRNILLVGMVIGGMLFLTQWHTPTHIAGELVTQRVQFLVEAVRSQQLLESVPIQAIEFTHFSNLTFRPATLEVADPAQLHSETNRYPETAWRPLKAFGLVQVLPQTNSHNASVSLRPTSPSASPFARLSSLDVAGGAEVILEMHPSPRPPVLSQPGDPESHRVILTVTIYGLDARAIVLPSQPVELLAAETKLHGIKVHPFSHETELTYRITPIADRPAIEVHGSTDRLVMRLTLVQDQARHLFTKGHIPVKSLDFAYQDATGIHRSALVGSGKIWYPEYPDLTPIPIDSTAYLSLDRLSLFFITNIHLTWDPPGLRIGLEGIADHIRTGRTQFGRDLRLSQFDKLWYHPAFHQWRTAWEEAT